MMDKCKIPWKTEESYFCPHCNQLLLGRLRGPKVTHELKCLSCKSKVFTADCLHKFREAQRKAMEPALRKFLKGLQSSSGTIN